VRVTEECLALRGMKCSDGAEVVLSGWMGTACSTQGICGK
jgi:hypothetical protein